MDAEQASAQWAAVKQKENQLKQQQKQCTASHPAADHGDDEKKTSGHHHLQNQSRDAEPSTERQRELPPQHADVAASAAASCS